MKYNKAFLGLFLATFLVIPSVSWAVPANKLISEERQAARDEAKAERQADKQEKFCDRIGNLRSNFENKVSQFEERVRVQQQTRAENYEKKTSEIGESLAATRLKIDENLKEHVAALELRAQTEEQKKAVSDFEEAVKKAIEARRKAIDAAQNAFHAEVRSQIQARKSVEENLAVALRNNQKAAFTKAVSSCESGTDPKTVMETLRNDLRLAKDNFVEEKGLREQVRVKLQAQIEIRKKAIEKAQNDFKAVMEKAKETLVSAFSQGSDSK